MTQNCFIKKINEKFGNKFNLSKVVLNNKDEEICIICPEHGEINVLPFIFLMMVVHYVIMKRKD